MIVFELPFPPSVNRLFLNTAAGVKLPNITSRKRQGRTVTEAYYNWREEAGKLILAQRIGQHSVHGPYRLLIELGRKNDKVKRDLGNFEKGLSDLLVYMGVIDDDSLAEEIIMRWRPQPGCRVEVTEIF